ncbi:MAG: hypothetical protein ACRD1J_02595, partial [Terriglobia bacterium]
AAGEIAPPDRDQVDINRVSGGEEAARDHPQLPEAEMNETNFPAKRQLVHCRSKTPSSADPASPKRLSCLPSKSTATGRILAMPSL